MKLLIDGENFRHQIAHVLYAHKKIADKNTYFSFNLSGFCRDILQEPNLVLAYYTTRIKQPRQKIPMKLTKLIDGISAANRKWIAALSNQGVEVIKAGHLRVRESNVCVHCGRKTLVLQEKGVDVRVATDVLLAAHQKHRQIAVASSDSDLIPSLEAAKRLGLSVVYVCYAGAVNRSVAAQATKVITFDDAKVLEYYGA